MVDEDMVQIEINHNINQNVNKHVKVDKTVSYVDETEIYRIQTEERMTKYNDRVVIGCFITLACICLICFWIVGIFELQEKKAVESGLVLVGYDGDFEGKKYEAVVEQLEKRRRSKG